MSHEHELSDVRFSCSIVYFLGLLSDDSKETVAKFAVNCSKQLVQMCLGSTPIYQPSIAQLNVLVRPLIEKRKRVEIWNHFGIETGSWSWSS